MQIEKVILASGFSLEKWGTWTHDNEPGYGVFESRQFLVIRSCIQSTNTRTRPVEGIVWPLGIVIVVKLGITISKIKDGAVIMG
ncbi:MAG: hypothetical protein TQ37_05565 [Candidatus Synechococcus spongiarum 15L]|uniref:Uncharacterized protein n=1 Tax=Candidatus Synechococcus spongiarum 15L TaxID=1608419 RepID=A0A0G8AV02_9SYNE|nr:MAG: hypothetical protein TQ37_05565 [Candidatus Synechococcus spongiarum 15L]